MAKDEKDERLCAWEKTTKPNPLLERWLPVVKLARMWEFDEVYKYAVKNMPYTQICKSPAEKVVIAFQYDIKPWLIPALDELAQREEPLGRMTSSFSAQSCC
ncbi:hypothetical protein J3R82DRAFT_1403 [Butyriboletus roseoflavus]|nr:hypothetical protein J3R82DRAFT_1403 [Butyriboletus roseoflavus]